MSSRLFAIGFAAALAASAAAPVAAQTVGTPGAPSGFGLAGGALAVSVSGSYGPERSATDDSNFDASGGLVLGFGNPATGLGVQGGVSITSFRNFGESGYLAFGAHKLFQASEAGVYSVALNVSHIAPWGDAEALDPGASLVGSYLTSVGSRLALFTLGLGNDMNNARDLKGIVAVGIGVSENFGASFGMVGDRSSIGLAVAPGLLGGNSLGISINHDSDSNENTLVVDIGRSFNLFKN